MEHKKLSLLIFCLICVNLFLVMSLLSCSKISDDEEYPDLQSLEGYSIAFFDEDEYLRFTNIEGQLSEPYEFETLVLYEGKQSSIGVHLGMYTWSPDGKQLGFISRMIGPWGVPTIYDTETKQLKICEYTSLPESQYRVWVLEDNLVLAVNSKDGVDQVLTVDFSDCTTSILYEATSQEFILEAALSSQGWLAISRYLGEAEGKYEILIISPDNNIFQIDGAGFPSWSKDGQRLAFFIENEGLIVSNKTGKNQLFISPISKLSFDTDDPDLASWSPNGDAIVFSNLYNIYVHWLDTSVTELLVEGGMFPNWRWDD